MSCNITSPHHVLPQTIMFQTVTLGFVEDEDYDLIVKMFKTEAPCENSIMGLMNSKKDKGPGLLVKTVPGKPNVLVCKHPDGDAWYQLLKASIFEEASNDS